VYIREGNYPNVTFGSVLGADGAGVVVQVGDDVSNVQLGQRVYINSMLGWAKDKRRPDSRHSGVLGHLPFPGTLADYIAVPKDAVVAAPSHLNWSELAAIPLAGLTAWRATMTLGEVGPGTKVLVPGIGGGVAVFCAQFAVGAGAEVWVTSSDSKKIERAVKQLGVKGGVNYRDKDWVRQLEKVSGGRFDSVIDGASGNNIACYLKLLNAGGIISVYGAVSGSQSTITMPFLWFKSAQIRGSMMGSAVEFAEMTQFVEKSRMHPVVSKLVSKLEDFEEAYEEMRRATQFGKIVVTISDDSSKL